MKGRSAKKRITLSKEQLIQKKVPVSIIKIKDVYKRKVKSNLKDKHKDSLSDKVIFQIIAKCLKDIPEEEYINKIPKKYLR